MGLTQGQLQAREWLEDLIHLHTKGCLLGRSVGGLRVALFLYSLAPASCHCSLVTSKSPVGPGLCEHFLDMSLLVEFGVSLTRFSLYPSFPMC